MIRIRLGIIGLGSFAEQHARILSRLPNVEVVAVSDPDPDRYARFKEWFPDARCYVNWPDMLASAELDAVDILTPEHLHTEPVKAALREGLHVFVEKPLAHNPEAAAELVQEAAASGRILMSGHLLRFDPRYAAVKERLAKGNLGSIRSIYAKRNNWKSVFSIYNRIEPVFILGIHDIDLMHWYMEDDVHQVYATRSTPEGSEAADMNWAILHFNKGGIGIIECNWLLPDGAPSYQDVRMEITADNGSVQIIDPEQGVTYIDETRPLVPAILNMHETHGRLGGALADELSHFVDCVASGKQSDILDPMDGYRAVRVAWAVMQSAKSGQPVNLPLLSVEE
ncbi:Gfo/Idh/MocA family protein [Paenibacillus nasutitermitis]|uniref:Dehydrogenase n=1 Tax=Paenibacillus nasutitermitis TaxID=1652958 RepID=A0A916YM13_9BACL|nr:Gfo/Idh/MocA family oxidoreductase [Paenibacillus nasutitermitis]GGD50917.1 dehydrogenase [Paenibacillus nasutitermitis]